MRSVAIFLALSLVVNRSTLASEANGVGWKASGKGGAVAAGGSGAVEAGIQHLQQGGNAADAAVATLLALSVTDYGLFAVGGEVPLLIYRAETREVKVLSGVADEVRAELSKRGHKLSTTSRPIAHPVMIHIDQQTGKIYAAGDPKAGRHAAALD